MKSILKSAASRMLAMVFVTIVMMTSSLFGQTFVEVEGVSAKVNAIAINDLTGDTLLSVPGVGIIVKNNGTTTTYDAGNGLPSNNTTSLAVSANGDIWVGTADAGVAVLSSGTWTIYNTGNGLVHSNVNCIFIDANYVWIGCSNGMSRWNGSFTNFPSNGTLFGDFYPTAFSVTGISTVDGYCYVVASTIDDGEVLKFPAAVLNDAGTSTKVPVFPTYGALNGAFLNGSELLIAANNGLVRLAVPAMTMTFIPSATIGASKYCYEVSTDVNNGNIYISMAEPNGYDRINGQMFKFDGTAWSEMTSLLTDPIIWSLNATDDGGLLVGTSTGAEKLVYPVTDVSVTPTSASLIIGNTQQLTSTVLPANATNPAITWSSLDNNIATVDANGLVTAVASGNTIIRVTTTDGGFTADCNVTVNSANVPVTGVLISSEQATLAIGETILLQELVLPTNASNKAVTWSSSNTAVASISIDANGCTVTAVGVGNCIVTVTTQDGGFTASCSVVVVTIPVTGVTVTPTTASLIIGETVQITAAIAPSNATNQNVTWSSSNNAIASVDATGLVTAISNGNAIITVTTEDGNFTATSNVTVNSANVPVTGVLISSEQATLAIGETILLQELVLPSNASNKTVSWNTSDPAVASISINANGCTVTAVTTGTCTITVTTVDGGFTATCSVTVIDTQAPSVPTGLIASSITSTGFTLSWNESTDNVGVIGYDIYINTVFNQTVIGTTVNISGLVPAVNYLIYIKARDAAGNTSSPAEIIVSTLPTGIVETLAENFSIYPNPVSNGGVLFVENFKGNYTVYDQLGRTVTSGEIQNEAINLSGIDQGIYFIHFTNKTETGVKKIKIE